MFGFSLKPITNAATIVTIAIEVLAAVTIVAALVIGFSEKPNNKPAHKKGVYASLIALVAGAGIGL
ncbi:MAG: hypothetical protein AAFY16_14700, partial [Cyanobacteria bacterium J06642_3]